MIGLIAIASTTEWEALCKIWDVREISTFVYGEVFSRYYENASGRVRVFYVRVGWGKISSAAATQFAIDNWKPDWLLNIGTCGGIGGRVKVGEIILATRTEIYDLHVEIGDAEAERNFYAVDLDTKWALRPPYEIRKGVIVSGDSDLRIDHLAMLVKDYDALGADWESGAIAFVATRNQVPCGILRFVSDLVHERHGESYGENQHLFTIRIYEGMELFSESISGWIAMMSTWSAV